jgi:mono/diheme cytochrome c family protein
MHRMSATVLRAALRVGALVGLALMGVLAGTGGSAAQDQALTAAGSEVYATNCATCHGERMVSTGSAFDLRKLGPDDRARFDASVTDGKDQMPAWGGVLSDEQFDQLWAYVRSRAN